MNYLPFRPIKNQAFRLYFSAISNSEGSQSLPDIGTWVYSGISKDGGTFDATTNAPVEITSDSGDGTSGTRSRSRYYIDLTATEMNADTIIIAVADDNGTARVPDSFIIYTSETTLAEDVWNSEPRTLTGSGSGVSNFSANFLNFLVDAIQASFDLVDFSLTEGDYNYYGVRHTNDDYLIVRELIIDSTLSYAYKENNNGKKYDPAWTNHAALIYADSQTKV